MYLRNIVEDIMNKKIIIFNNDSNYNKSNKKSYLTPSICDFFHKYLDVHSHKDMCDIFLSFLHIIHLFKL